MEYARSTLVSAASGDFPFMAAQGYQPPLFDYPEEKAVVPSVQVYLCRCRRIWQQVRATLLGSSLQSQRWANCHSSAAPSYSPGQRVWLAPRISKDLPPGGLKEAGYVAI